MKSNFLKTMALLLTIGLFASGAHADDAPPVERKSFISRFGATLGADYDIGKLGNSSIDVPSRTMNAVSVEALIGYRVGRFLIGPDFDYRVEGQLSGLSGANGTNLKGKGWLIGLGAKYDLSERWAIQAAVDFLGKYKFDRQTSASEDDHLEKPIVIRAKAQYFMFRTLPLSVDLDLQYISYGKWHVTSVDYTSATNGYMAGVGATWHFGSRPFAQSQVEPANVVTKEVVTAPPQAVSKDQVEEFKADLSKVVDVKKTSEGLMIDIKGDASFESSSSDLTAESKTNLQKTAVILAKKPNLKIRIQGHSDSSGNKFKNQTLSEARAKSVKDLFIENGLKAENISSSGFGDSKPIESNETKEGRAANRRVEIRLDE